MRLWTRAQIIPKWKAYISIQGPGSSNHFTVRLLIVVIILDYNILFQKIFVHCIRFYLFDGCNKDGHLFNRIQHILLSFILPTFAKVLIEWIGDDKVISVDKMCSGW